MVDVRLNTAPAGAASRLVVNTTAGLLVQAGPYLLSDGRSLVDPLPSLVSAQPVLQAGGLFPPVTPADLASSVGDVETLEFINANGSRGATTTISGARQRDFVLGMVFKTSGGVPAFDGTVGWHLINGWSSGSSSALAFWRYAESDDPPFGVHVGGNKAEFYVYRSNRPPANPIGDVTRVAGSGLLMPWTGLVPRLRQSRVLTMGYRAANELIVPRPGALAVSGASGSSARYLPLRSDGAVTAWPELTTKQAIAGAAQSVAIEIGYPALEG